MANSRIKCIIRAFESTKQEMFISLLIVVLLTIGLSVIFYLVEHNEQPDVFTSWGDAIVWAYSRYIEGGDGVFDGGPSTVIGKFIAFSFGIIGIAIVAIPAGLVASGFSEAIETMTYEKKLEEIREKISVAFLRKENKQLKSYLKQKGEYKNEMYFVPQRIPMSTFQIKLGISFNDILETANRFDEVLIKDTEGVISNNAGNNCVVEIAPITKDCPYGCNIDRKSPVTIVATSASDELGTIWFGYYLALFGGFNYVCKSKEICKEDKDSFYFMTDEPTYACQTESELTNSNSKDSKRKIDVIKSKKLVRKQFEEDILKYASQKDHWIICLHDGNKKGEGVPDICFIDGSDKEMASTIQDRAHYESIIESCAKTFSDSTFDIAIGNGLSSRQLRVGVGNDDYPLNNKFLLYYIQRKYNLQVNGFALRPTVDLIYSNEKNLIVLYELASNINKALELNTPTINEEDINRRCDYSENIMKKNHEN